MDRDEVLRLARDAEVQAPGGANWQPFVASLERFAALVAAAERARMPPPPLVVDVSSIDPGELADMMMRARPDSAPVLEPGKPSRKQHIDALVGDRLTAQKADHICERDGYAVTGVVLTLPDGRACIVNRSAVRWLSDKGDLFNLLHTDSALNHRQVAEAVAAEREACAADCCAAADRLAACPPSPENQSAISALRHRAAAIRARGT